MVYRQDFPSSDQTANKEERDVRSKGIDEQPRSHLSGCRWDDDACGVAVEAADSRKQFLVWMANQRTTTEILATRE